MAKQDASLDFRLRNLWEEIKHNELISKKHKKKDERDVVETIVDSDCS